MFFSRSTTTLTKQESKSTNDWWQESSSQYWHHGSTDQSLSVDQTYMHLYNIIDLQTLPFTWLWRWLPLRLLKCQSLITVHFRTTLSQTITQDNHSTNKLYMLIFPLLIYLLKFHIFKKIISLYFNNIVQNTNWLSHHIHCTISHYSYSVDSWT